MGCTTRKQTWNLVNFLCLCAWRVLFKHVGTKVRCRSADSNFTPFKLQLLCKPTGLTEDVKSTHQNIMNGSTVKLLRLISEAAIKLIQRQHKRGFSLGRVDGGEDWSMQVKNVQFELKICALMRLYDFTS